jgi:hypothetical protein
MLSGFFCPFPRMQGHSPQAKYASPEIPSGQSYWRGLIRLLLPNGTLARGMLVTY